MFQTVWYFQQYVKAPFTPSSFQSKADEFILYSFIHNDIKQKLQPTSILDCLGDERNILNVFYAVNPFSLFCYSFFPSRYSNNHFIFMFCSISSSLSQEIPRLSRGNIFWHFSSENSKLSALDLLSLLHFF